MKGRFLLASYSDSRDPNIYADKSALVIEWLLQVGIKKEAFSVREVGREIGISVGLVQKVFRVLVLMGYLRIEGLRTAKKFRLKKPEQLLKEWLQNYSIIKKCKIRTYRSGFQNREQLLNQLSHSVLKQRIRLALHSAAEYYGYKNTNLETLELYLLEPGLRVQLEEILQLEPQEKGYEVLLIEPYYKNMLKKNMLASPMLLTFLDLYHFPLRGQEQAEFMAERAKELKRIYKRT